jgi:aspartate carbamoyltransferase catalytic subunit
MLGFPSVLESITDLNQQQITNLLSLSQKIKKTYHDPSVMSLKNIVVATCFLENSTRTKNSFALSAQKLGAIYLNFDPATSSLNKGETLEETFLTLYHMGVDLCVVRTSLNHHLSPFKENPLLKIINGGDGTNQHPTQALLDLFTLQELGFPQKGKRFTIIGDISHSRVANSLTDLLPQFGFEVQYCGPEEFIPKKVPSHIKVLHDADEAIAKSDVIYLLRIQKERHIEFGVPNDIETYPKKFGLNLDKITKKNIAIPVFHPGPANIGVEISADLIKSKYYMGHLQVEHSMYMRMSLIKSMIENGVKHESRIAF